MIVGASVSPICSRIAPAFRAVGMVGDAPPASDVWSACRALRLTNEGARAPVENIGCDDEDQRREDAVERVLAG